MAAIRLLFFGNLFMAACGALWTAATYYQLSWLGTAMSYPLLLLVSSGTLVLYNAARYPFSIKTGAFSLPVKEAWEGRHPVGMGLLITLGSVAGLYALLKLPLLKLWPLGVAGLLVVAYYAPVFQGKPFGFRMFGVLKNLIIGLVWSLVTVLTPITLNTNPFGHLPEVIPLMAERTLFIYLLMLPFDVEDVDRDAAEGVTTIPVTRGLRFTKVLMGGLLGLLVLSQVTRYTGGLLMAQLAASIYILILLILLRAGRSELHFLFWWDGAIALQALLTITLA